MERTLDARLARDGDPSDGTQPGRGGRAGRPDPVPDRAGPGRPPRRSALRARHRQGDAGGRSRGRRRPARGRRHARGRVSARGDDRLDRRGRRDGRRVSDSYRVAHLDDLDRIAVAGGQYRPIRRRLGVRAFGINAYTAEKAGDQVVEHHTEGAGGGSGRQEELYMVVAGHAEFTVAGETIDAPAGTMVFVPDLTAQRSAVARADGTTVVVVGGPADAPIPTSPFEYWFAAEPAYRAGDYDRAAQIASEGLAEWPQHATLHYQLACYRALAGRRDEALEHLRIAVAN